MYLYILCIYILTDKCIQFSKVYISIPKRRRVRERERERYINGVSKPEQFKAIEAIACVYRPYSSHSPTQNTHRTHPSLSLFDEHKNYRNNLDTPPPNVSDPRPGPEPLFRPPLYLLPTAPCFCIRYLLAASLRWSGNRGPLSPHCFWISSALCTISQT